MKQSILIILLLNLWVFASEDLLIQAQKLEEAGQYKEAMLLYKKLVLKDQQIEKNIVETTVKTSEKKEENIVKSGIDHIKNAFKQVEDPKANSTIEQALSSAFDLYPYKENYFLPISHDTKPKADRKQNETKFQISVKRPITYNLLGLNETFNFGYTQTSWWQLYEDSAPFRETNYQPEVYMIAPFHDHDNSPLKAYKVGFLHESNGRHGDDSRSWNRVYLEGYYQFDNLFVVPRVWYRIPESRSEDDNPDIQKYLGYGDLNLYYVYGEHTFKVLLRNNFRLNDNKGFIEADWMFPLPGTKSTFGYLQLSNGYGDSLIDYDKNISRIGFGISLSR